MVGQNPRDGVLDPAGDVGGYRAGNEGAVDESKGARSAVFWYVLITIADGNYDHTGKRFVPEFGHLMLSGGIILRGCPGKAGYIGCRNFSFYHKGPAVPYIVGDGE